MNSIRALLLSLLICAAPLAAAHADARNTYPFDASDDLLARAQLFESWHAAVIAHQQSRASLYACATDRSACRGRLKSFNRVMAKANGLSTLEKIEVVNYYINRGRYDEDRWRKLHNEEGKRIGWLRNSWTSLHDFLIHGGDCEDYASSKYFMLRELGFAAQDLRIVVARSRELGGSHAVLAVRLADGAVWLLDSDNRIRKRSHRGYRYIYAMNEDFVWDHRADYAGPEGLSNKPSPVHNEKTSVDGKTTP